MRKIFKFYTLVVIAFTAISCKAEVSDAIKDAGSKLSSTKDSSRVAITKIASDNGEDTIYIEKYEKFIKDKKIYINHIYYHDNGRNEKMYVGQVEDFRELISIYEFEYSISFIYLRYYGNFGFINFTYGGHDVCGKTDRWIRTSYVPGLIEMAAYDGIKNVGWISASMFYSEPLNHKKRKRIQAVIDDIMWELAVDEDAINNKYLDYKKWHFNSFSKYFSNNTWSGMRYEDQK